ncbi:hypothetical protein [Bacillus siamensis]|uniref:hypothetical protein n=1 Tax=Bacillus siamensis TaxID=659243 RepID=UPI001595E983|nr:hypothetical protein [Bacillus siamensis]
MKKQKKRISFFAEKPNQEGHIGLVPGYTGEFGAVKTDTLPAAIKERFKENKSNEK